MIKYVSAIPTILISYLVVIFYKVTYSLFYLSTNKAMYWIGPFALFFYCFISYLAYRRNKIALWLMIFSLFVSGMGGLILGIFTVPISQIALKIIFTVVGIYFVFGTFKLYTSLQSSINKVTENQIKI